jgi:cysteine desulfurase / selenocysteine lyase
VKVLSITAASNVTGSITDFVKICAICDNLSVKPLLIVDGSQSFSHFRVDVEKYGIDFFIATGHKVFADTGIGILYGRKDLLQKMAPALCGGGAINSVSVDGYEPA